MDYLLSAVPRLWIPLGSQEVEEIQLAEVLEGEGLTEAQLLDAGILCGVEPLRGSPTLIPKTAFSWVRYYGSLESVAQKKRLTFLSEPGRIEEVRQHFRPRAQWFDAIREDTKVENWDFLSTL
jgi:5'-3' exonuclease